MLLKAEYFQKNDDTCFSDLHRSNLKILTPKQVLQRLPIALAQVKAGNTSYILCIKQIKLLKKYVTINEFNKGIIQKWVLYF